MSRQRCPLHQVVLLAWFCVGRAFEAIPEAPEEEPQFFCNLVCCGDPVTIPEEQDFQMFIIPFIAEEQTVFPTPIDKTRALENLSADFLQPETIADLASPASNFYQVDSSALDRFANSRCDIPIASACLVQKCGCNARRRKLRTVCLPVFACATNTAGALMDADLEGTIQLPPYMIFGICLMGKCTLFQIQPQNAGDYNFALTTTCPNVLPVPPPQNVVQDPTSGTATTPSESPSTTTLTPSTILATRSDPSVASLLSRFNNGSPFNRFTLPGFPSFHGNLG